MGDTAKANLNGIKIWLESHFHDEIGLHVANVGVMTSEWAHLNRTSVAFRSRDFLKCLIKFKLCNFAFLCVCIAANANSNTHILRKTKTIHAQTRTSGVLLSIQKECVTQTQIFSCRRQRIEHFYTESREDEINNQ